jgi:acyl dehydratase
MAELFLEDFAVGQAFGSSRSVRVDKDEIIAFAKKYDPQFFHLDEVAARNSIFGGLVASGWLTAALTMRLLTERESKPAGGSIGLGFDELRWPIPVRPGDELRIESEVLDVRPSKSRPDRGVVKMRTRTFNQHGQVVQEIVNIAMVPRRPPARNDKADAARSTPERRAV